MPQAVGNAGTVTLSSGFMNANAGRSTGSLSVSLECSCSLLMTATWLDSLPDAGHVEYHRDGKGAIYRHFAGE